MPLCRERIQLHAAIVVKCVSITREYPIGGTEVFSGVVHTVWEGAGGSGGGGGKGDVI